jgi:exodeoxyribonuclease-3
MRLRVATWNVNSVRLRLPGLARLAADRAPDVICLQETKVADELFPRDFFADLDYPHQAVYGQKGYHGVAIVSRLPFEKVARRAWCGKADARHLHVRLPGPLLLHNFYVPSGGDVPDADENPKFAHKLGFIDEVAAWFRNRRQPARQMLVGDLNVAPLETDVWSHKQLLKVVSHTPVEVEALARLAASRGWVDAVRHFVPPEQRLYTWWSYRARDWQAADRGRRLDHIWVSPKLAPALAGAEVLRAARGWPAPSDHVPVIVDLAR